METPPYLVDQYAAERGISATMAKRLLYLEGLDTQARKVGEVAGMLGLAPATLKAVARKLVIDFADYRPYAKRRDAGEEMGVQIKETRAPASGLPLFGKAA